MLKLLMVAAVVLVGCGGGADAVIDGDWHFTVGIGDLAQQGTLHFPGGQRGPEVTGTFTLDVDAGTAHSNAPACDLRMFTGHGEVLVQGDCSAKSWSGRATGAGFDSAPFTASR